MRNYLIAFVLFSLFFVGSAQATGNGLGEFFSFITGIGEDFWSLTTESIPSMFERFLAWLLEWYVLAQIFAFKSALEISWNVASVILEDLALGSKLNVAIGFLPNDVQAALVQFRILDAIELIFQAYVTRFAMDLIR